MRHMKKKKLEFKKNFEIEQDNKRDKELEEKKANEDKQLQFEKNKLKIKYDNKIENYRSNLMNEYNEKLRKQKEDVLKSLEGDLISVRSNFETTKNYYEQQKLIFQAEQSANNATVLLDRMKHIIENKSNVFKNLLEQNYTILKNKIKECEEMKELDNLSNKDVILQKISGLLNMIFFINIYETLYNDMVNEKDFLGKYLDDLIQKCDGIIATLNSEKKIQLSHLVNKPNFY